MDWSQIGSTLARIGLPALGTAFGGPMGGLIGGALGNAVASALGTEPTPEAVSSALRTTDPEVVKAKLADLESARQTDLQMYQAQLGDVQSARTMQVALASVPEEHGLIKLMPSIQTAVNWAFALGAVLGVAMGWLREDGIIVGFCIGQYTSGTTFWLGSSAGSKRSADAVRSIAQNATLPGLAQVASRALDTVKSVVR